MVSSRLKKTAAAFLAAAFFFFFVPLRFFSHLWDRLAAREADSPGTAPSLMPQVYAAILTSVDEALKTFMRGTDEVIEETRTLSPEQIKKIGEATNLELNPSAEATHVFYVGKRAGKVSAYAVRDQVPGKWGPIIYMLLISPEGEILDVMVLEYEEKRGRPVAKNRFLRQFEGKTVESPLRMMRDLKGVTGASISSNGMANGIRKMMHIFDAFYGRRS